MSIILPGEGYSSNPLKDYFRQRGEAKFRHEVELADVLSLAVSQVARKRRLRNPDVLNGILTSLVSAVQAAAPEEEWGNVGSILAEELRGRLTVRQVN